MPRTLPRHVIVDGSNIATEGRSHPSLKQLDEAVSAFMAENPDHTVTVVVDATFGHRIDKAEVVGVRRCDRRQRARVAARRSHRPRRCVRAADRRQGRCDGAVERQLPGVPRRVRLAVRRGTADGRQAGPAHRMGVRAPQPGPRADQPPRAPVREEGRRRAACEEARGAALGGGVGTDARAEVPAADEAQGGRSSRSRGRTRRSRPRLSIRSARPPTRSTRCSRSSNSSPTIPSARPSRRRSSRSPRTAPTRHPSRCAATSRFGIWRSPRLAARARC